MGTQKCDGCNEPCEETLLTDVTQDGDDMLFCPRCVFIVALYHENGIDKVWERGSIHPSFISNSVRKIVEKEFYKDPYGTYKKYLGNMIDRQEKRDCVIHVTDKVIDNITTFPFLFLEPNEANKYHFKENTVVTLKSENKKLTRNLYGFRTIEAKYLKQYGHKQTSTVLFLTD